MYKGILAGDRSILSRGITLIESSLSNDFAEAQNLIQLCLPHSGNSLRIGVTGVPGVGKKYLL